MHLVVYGVGGAGGAFGAQLIRAGERISFIARGAHLDRIRAAGLRLTTDNEDFVVRPETVTDDVADLPPVDGVLLGVKAYQVVGLADSLRQLLANEHAFVLPLQNGVETTDALVESVGDQHVLGALCGTVSWVSAPGRIKSLGTANIIRFGELDNRRSDRTERLRQMLENAGIDAEIPADIRAAQWEKFLFVVSVGGVAGLHEMTVGEIRSNPKTRRQLEQCMREIHTLAGHRGVLLSPDLVDKTMGFVDELPYAATTSMQRDIANNKPSELEAWNGAVVRLAAEVNIEVPAHQQIYTALCQRVGQPGSD